MRVLFVPPSANEFLHILTKEHHSNQIGEGVYVSPVLRQRGFGFLSILRSLASRIIPFAKSKVLPSLATAAGNFTSGMLSDLVSDEPGPWKARVKKRGMTALKEVASGVKDRIQQTGQGRRKLRTRSRKVLKRKINKKPGGRRRNKTKNRRKKVNRRNSKFNKGVIQRRKRTVGVRKRKRTDVFSA
jgi:hypothetical protein